MYAHNYVRIHTHSILSVCSSWTMLIRETTLPYAALHCDPYWTDRNLLHLLLRHWHLLHGSTRPKDTLSQLCCQLQYISYFATLIFSAMFRFWRHFELYHPSVTLRRTFCQREPKRVSHTFYDVLSETYKIHISTDIWFSGEIVKYSPTRNSEVKKKLYFEVWINLPTWCNWVFICVLSARHVSGLHAHLQEQWMLQFLYICSIWCPWCS